MIKASFLGWLFDYLMIVKLMTVYVHIYFVYEQGACL